MGRVLAILATACVVGCGPAPACHHGEVPCGDSCVDPQLDPGNCGACGRACEVGDVCSAATCAGNCLAGTTLCGDRCSELATDNANCGTCGHACGGGQVCAGGTCSGACGSLDKCGDRCVDIQSANADCGACDHACAAGQFCLNGACTASNIQHVVLIVEENHTFDSYFGNYCTAAAGSNPTCTSGPSCCEGAPATEASGSPPIVLDDMANAIEDRDHDRVCEVAQINGGAMDHYVVGSGVTVGAIEGLYTYDCSDPHNFAVADSATLLPYWTLANGGALADRYFQPMVGSTSGNDMYLAVAQWQFDDNNAHPATVGAGCLSPGGNAVIYEHVATVADLLVNNGYSFHMYADGYADAVASAPLCASQAGTFPSDCEAYERTGLSTCNYDPSDLPFQYYKQFADKPAYISDFAQLSLDMANGQLPSLAYVKARTYRNEHPKWSTISRGTTFVTGVVNAIEQSPYADSTLILLVWDEGGGFYDHVPPPPAVGPPHDQDAGGAPVPYGTRVPLLALGKFARAGAISHAQLEHSSIVRFVEYNFLGPRLAGALGHRDAIVPNLGSLLDPAQTGVVIP